ncbi:UNVERIFIED_CONTAM: hypothetical protein FKN15_011542 [Acipenser sinensis]
MQEATRKQSESKQQLRQKWGLPTWEQEFPVTQLELVLQKLVWPAPQQESRVPEPEPEVQALEPELPAPERKTAVQELQLPEEEELPPSESEGEELPELQQELQLYEEEELTCPAPPQPRPPPQQSSPALVGTVPCPVLGDTLPECMDLPVLDLVPRSGHHQAQLLTWSLAPLPLKPQTSRRGRVTSLAFPQPLAVFPLESQRSLRRSRGSHLCLSLHRPGYRPTRRSPLASRLGPSSPDRGPYPEAPEKSTHPQAHPKDREKMGLCGLEGKRVKFELLYGSPANAMRVHWNQKIKKIFQPSVKVQHLVKPLDLLKTRKLHLDILNQERDPKMKCLKHLQEHILSPFKDKHQSQLPLSLTWFQFSNEKEVPKLTQDTCNACEATYGDGSDPKSTEEWIACNTCRVWYHESCVKGSGIFNDITFTSRECCTRKP